MKLTLGNQEIEITEEQRQQFINALMPNVVLDEADNWPREGSTYWTIWSEGVTDLNWDDDITDKFSKSIGQVFRTEEEAKAHVRYLKALTRVKGSSSFSPNWEDTDQVKYFVGYDYTKREFYVDWTTLYGHIGAPVYYESREASKQAIKDHKEDFLILAGVK